MASGVKVAKECVAIFEEMKMKHAYRFLTFKLNDTHTEIILADTKGPEGTYEDFKQVLLDAAKVQQCRYAVFDLDFEFKGQKKNKIIFVAWSPETATMKQKMVYTSSKDYIKKALQMNLEQQATDAEEISLASLIERAQRNMKD